MANRNLVSDIDVSRHVRRLRIVRLMDYGLVYVYLPLMVQMGLLTLDALSANKLELFVPCVISTGVAAHCFLVGLRNIGTVASRTWTAYAWILWVALAAWLLAAATIAATDDKDPEMGLVALMPAAWVVVTLMATMQLKSMKLDGIGATLPELAKTMPDTGRMSLLPDGVERLKLVNVALGGVMGLLGLGLLVVLIKNGWYAFCPASFFFLVLMRRYFQIDADSLLKMDRRPPILFLRAFEDDEKFSFRRSAEALFGDTLEMRLSRHFMHFGPFVAIGSPADELPMPGAARVRLSDAEWQNQVRRWMGSAQIIVMYVGNTYWVNWELALLASKGRLHKLILLFPARRGWLARSKKVADDVHSRLRCLKGALGDTHWARALASIEADGSLRALVLRPDGTVAAVRSRRDCPEAYHLAVLIGHSIARAQPAGPVLRLKASQPPMVWALHGGATRIGSARRNEIALERDGLVSAEHACIETSGNGICVVDLGSRNGTFVNGAPLGRSRQWLRLGDEIRIGHTVLELRQG